LGEDERAAGMDPVSEPAQPGHHVIVVDAHLPSGILATWLDEEMTGDDSSHAALRQSLVEAN
jgi:hypothetical protein